MLPRQQKSSLIPISKLLQFTNTHVLKFGLNLSQDLPKLIPRNKSLLSVWGLTSQLPKEGVPLSICRRLSSSKAGFKTLTYGRCAFSKWEGFLIIYHPSNRSKMPFLFSSMGYQLLCNPCVAVSYARKDIKTIHGSFWAKTTKGFSTTGGLVLTYHNKPSTLLWLVNYDQWHHPLQGPT